jgi:hypothetical protein
METKPCVQRSTPSGIYVCSLHHETDGPVSVGFAPKPGSLATSAVYFDIRSHKLELQGSALCSQGLKISMIVVQIC